MRRDGYGVAECDHHGALPSTRPADVTWIGTVIDARNIPDPNCLMDFETARNYAVALVRTVLHVRRQHLNVEGHDSYAVIHVTPDGWAPVMWAAPDTDQLDTLVRLTLTNPPGE